jgi:hypothetical protein
MTARAPIRHVGIDVGSTAPRQETDEMHVTSRAADGRLFMCWRNELHVRSQSVARRWPVRAHPCGALLERWLVKIADRLHYTRLRARRDAHVIAYKPLVEVLPCSAAFRA